MVWVKIPHFFVATITDQDGPTSGEVVATKTREMSASP